MALAKHSPSVDQPDESSYFHIICIVEVRNVVVGEHRGIETCLESLYFLVRTCTFNHNVQHVIGEHAFPRIYWGCQILCMSFDPWCTCQDVRSCARLLTPGVPVKMFAMFWRPLWVLGLFSKLGSFLDCSLLSSPSKQYAALYHR